MRLTQDQYRLWVSSFFKSKVKEFNFFLRSVVECCDQSMDRFHKGQQGNEQTESRIVYTFSAFSNTVQSLKDSGSTFLKPKIVWSDIEGLRHGTFIWLSRNAATHDGNPVISGWADGRYFVPKDIHRFDSSGKLIEIPAPTVDVAQFCLEFAKDFSNFLLLRLSSLGPIEVPRTSIEDIEKSLDSVMVPAFARQIFTAHKSQIERALMLVKSDPIGDAISLLRETVTYCETRLCT